MAWSDVEKLPVVAANQLAVTVDALGSRPDLIVLSIGHATPPIVTGTPDQQRAAIAEIKQVTVQPVVRVTLSLGRLKEWTALLQQTVAKIEELETGES